MLKRLWFCAVGLVFFAGCQSTLSNATPVSKSVPSATATLTPLPTLILTQVVYIVVTNTPTPTPSRTPTSTITPTPQVIINGLTFEDLVMMPPEVRANVRRIYAHGQELGRDPGAFSKLGDSTIENPHFMDRFDTGSYNLGQYSYLQPAIDQFSGSFARQSVAVRRGLHSWSVFDPIWADGRCLPNETIITCEIRLHNPSMIYIRLGSNDVGVPESFDRNLRRLVEYCIENGVIPLLGTKADRNDGADNINNAIIRQVAADYAVPLWDFDRAAATLPGRGLTFDNVHMTTFFPHDYTSPVAFQRGYSVHNLVALLVLDAVWQEVRHG